MWLIIFIALAWEAPSLADLAALHEANLKQIRSLRAEIEVFDTEGLPADEVASTTPGLHRKIYWTYSDLGERMRIVDFRRKKMDGSFTTGTEEYSNTPKGYFTSRYGPERSPPSAVNTTVTGTMEPRQPIEFISVFPTPNYMWLRFLAIQEAPDQSVRVTLLSLSELLAKATKKSAEKLVDGRIKLTVEASFGKHDRVNAEYVLDPARNFMIAEAKGTNAWSRVEEWRTIDHLQLPKRVVSAITLGKGPTKTTIRTFNYLAVNFNPSPSDLAIEFPEWAVVHQHPEQWIHVWGHGAPKLTFKTSAEFKTWRDQQKLEQGHLQVKAQAEAAASTGWPWWVWVALAAGLVLAAVLVERHRRRAA